MAGVKEVAARVAESMEITKVAAEEAVRTVMQAIVDTAYDDGAVNLRGVGTFKVKDVKERVGRNPQTGESLTIPASQKLTFKSRV